MSEGVGNGEIEVNTRQVRGEVGSDQCQAEPRSEGRVIEVGGQSWAIDERVSREAGPWASIAFLAIGGILGQLIKDLEYQLAYQQSSIDWYMAEIKKNEEAVAWHKEKLTDVEERLANLKAHAEAIRQSISD